jgi:phosphomannomutase
VNLSLTPAEGGMTRAAAILAALRAAPPETIAGRSVIRVIDRHCGKRTETWLRSGRRVELAADNVEVLTFVLSADGTDRITVRPSGTEPKMKLYGQLGKPAAADADDAATEAALAAAEREVADLLNAAMDQFKSA